MGIPVKDTLVRSITVNGSAGILVYIECRLSNNLPVIVIVGSANRAVGESKERIRGAFASSRIVLPRKRITVNLAPADVPKADSGFDLAIAVAIMLAGGQIGPEAGWRRRGRPVFIGELGLDGAVRPVRGIIGKILAGRAAGITVFFIPAANLGQARLVPGVSLVPVSNLLQLYLYLSGKTSYAPLYTGEGGRMDGADAPRAAGGTGACGGVRLSEIVGQQQAKRALEIAAAGGHNLFLDGPPGTGKSMLAKALPGLLPPMEREEILQVTHLHSLAGHDYDRIVSVRPFRAPHHGASLISITGGGSPLRPGEISLAHRGVLFFDELPEFNRESIETLRQPLESRLINVTRSHGQAQWPADFIFVATANPCPCGWYGSDRSCTCGSQQIKAYRGRLSGPIMDRMDIYTNVSKVEHGKLLAQTPAREPDSAVIGRVARARELQAGRFGNRTKLNAHMNNPDIRRLSKDISSETLALLNRSARHMNLSARAYMRSIKVARTIADLESSPAINGSHLSEALSYRPVSTSDRSKEPPV